MDKRKKLLGNIIKFLTVFLFLFLVSELSEDSPMMCGSKVWAKTESETKEFGANNQETADIITSNLTVHFIDVGQGDATLFICDGEAMLLDAGNTESGTEIQLYLKKNGVEKLKYLILTHPDEEHIGGADVIITKFDIDNVFMPSYEKDTKSYEELISALAYRWYQWSTPTVGETYTLGNSAFTIVAPNREYGDENNSSIGILLTHGNNKFLFTGDAEEEAENDIISNGISLDCDVYKAGHHGSKTSSNLALLETATPEFVVVSCGEGNSYGHPHAEPMNYFRSLGMKLFRTDEQGTVIVASDGTNLGWNMAPTESWNAGEPIGASNDLVSQLVLKSDSEADSFENLQSERIIPETGSSFAVNGKNGKIHIVGACSATGNGKQAMKQPVYFVTFEEAEKYSIQYHPGQNKRKCGNCW